MSAQRLPAPLEHYLATGCYRGADLDLFLLAGRVIRGELTGLRALWADIEPFLKGVRTRDWFAVLALRLPSREWPPEYGPEACSLHSTMSKPPKED